MCENCYNNCDCHLNKMSLPEAIGLIYGLVENDITEDSDEDYQIAKEVVEKFLDKY